jgi:hypothetical protein
MTRRNIQPFFFYPKEKTCRTQYPFSSRGPALRVFAVHVSLITGIAFIFFISLFLLFLPPFYYWIWAANHYGIAGVQYIYIYTYTLGSGQHSPFMMRICLGNNDAELLWDFRSNSFIVSAIIACPGRGGIKEICNTMLVPVPMVMNAVNLGEHTMRHACFVSFLLQRKRA